MSTARGRVQDSRDTLDSDALSNCAASSADIANTRPRLTLLEARCGHGGSNNELTNNNKNNNNNNNKAKKKKRRGGINKRSKEASLAAAQATLEEFIRATRSDQQRRCPGSRPASVASAGSMRSRRSIYAYSVMSSAGPRSRVTPGWANPTRSESAITSLAAAIQQWSPELAERYGVAGTSITPELRTLCGQSRDVREVLNSLTNREHMHPHFMTSDCKCVAEMSVHALMAATSLANRRRPPVQALLCALDGPEAHPCPRCGAITDFYDHPHIRTNTRHLIVVIRSKATDSKGAVRDLSPDIQGASYNGAAVFFRNQVWMVTSIVCNTPPSGDYPGHYYTLVPRGRNLFLVDEDKAVRRLMGEAKANAFGEAVLLFLSEIQYKPNSETSFLQPHDDREEPRQEHQQNDIISCQVQQHEHNDHQNERQPPDQAQSESAQSSQQQEELNDDKTANNNDTSKGTCSVN
eukprot:PhM_4_TR15237/c0_g1_i1/m.39470